MQPPGRIWSSAFALAFVGHFLAGLAIHGFVHLPGLLKSWNASGALIGAIVSCLSLSAIAARPWIGRWMDERGRRRVVIIGGALHVVACIAYLAVDRIGGLLVAIRIVHGLADAMLFSAFFTMAADMVPAARRTEGIAIFGVSGMLPISLGPLLGDLVLEEHGYHELFWVLAGLAFLGFVASLFIPETRPESAVAPRGVLVALRRPRLLPLWMAGIVFALALVSYFVFLKNFVEAESLGTVSTFFTPYALTAVLLRLVAGWLPDRVGPRRMLFPSMIFLAAGIVGLGLAQSPTHVMAMGVLAGLGHGYTFPILSTLIVERTPAADRGSALTIFTALFDVGLLLGGPTLGAVVDAFGARIMFFTAAAIGLAGLAVFALWDRPTSTSKPD